MSEKTTSPDPDKGPIVAAEQKKAPPPKTAKPSLGARLLESILLGPNATPAGGTGPNDFGARAPGLDQNDQPGFYQPEPDQPLRPHAFEPEVEILGEALPRVLITPEAYKCMCLYVAIATKEVGWMGTISRTAGGDFLIEETFLLEQEVHETETELESEAIGKLTMTLIDGDANGVDKANKLRFWGHSHVRMGTSPSGTDERTMERFGREGNPWYVRGIFNKLGRGSFTIYLFDRGLRINDAAWVVWDPVKKRAVMQNRRRFGAFTSLVQGAGEIVGVPVSPTPSELEPSPELRASIEAEFKAKVKERKWGFWNSWRSAKSGAGKEPPESAKVLEGPTDAPAALTEPTVAPADTTAAPINRPAAAIDAPDPSADGTAEPDAAKPSGDAR